MNALWSDIVGGESPLSGFQEHDLLLGPGGCRHSYGVGSKVCAVSFPSPPPPRFPSSSIALALLALQVPQYPQLLQWIWEEAFPIPSHSLDKHRGTHFQ